MSPRPAIDRRTLLTGSLGLAAAFVAGCGSGRTSGTAAPTRPSSPSARPSPQPSVTEVNSPSSQPSMTELASPSSQPSATASASPPAADPAAMAARATVPVLCWHQLRDWQAADSAYARRLLICPPSNFRAQLDALAEDGWITISPDRYLQHLTTGSALPAKPVMLSFDDSQGSQMTEGLPQLGQRGMTATFFCMTVVLDKPDWMSRDDLRRLVDADMTVAAHTYDHHRADRYTDQDWKLQFDAPRELLELVIRRPVEHFAYPYGAWGPTAFEHLQSAGYKTAFQLSDDALDPAVPLFTLRRILVDSTWSGVDALRQLRGPV